MSGDVPSYENYNVYIYNYIYKISNQMTMQWLLQVASGCVGGALATNFEGFVIMNKNTIICITSTVKLT